MNIKNIDYVIKDFYNKNNFLSQEKKLFKCKYDTNDLTSFINEKLEFISIFNNNEQLRDIEKYKRGDLDFDLKEINDEIENVFDIENMIYFFRDSFLEFIENNYDEETYTFIYNEYFDDFFNNIELDISNLQVSVFDNDAIYNINRLSYLLNDIDEIEKNMNDDEEAYNNAEIDDDEYERDVFIKSQEVFNETENEIESLACDLISDFSDFYENNLKILEYIENSLSNLNNVFSDIMGLLENKNNLVLKSKAEKYIDELNFFSKNIGVPKLGYEKQQEIKFELLLNNNHFIIFDDISIIYKEENIYKFFDNTYRSNNLNKIYKKIMENYIKYKNRKNPIIEKYINKKINELKNQSEFESLLDLNDYILEKKILFKKFDIKIEDYFEKKHEVLYDKIQEIDKLNRIDVFYKRELSGKYSILKSDQNENLFKKWIDSNLNEEDFNKYISKKMAAILNTEDPKKEFKEIIEKNINLLTKWGNHYIINSFEKLNIEKNRYIENNEIIIVKLNNYDECKALGSTSWCINRSSSFYENYKKENNEFFILFNTNQDKSNIESMIGFHLQKKDDNEYNIVYSHLKNDSITSKNIKDKILSLCNSNNDFFSKFYNKRKSKIKLNN